MGSAIIEKQNNKPVKLLFSFADYDQELVKRLEAIRNKILVDLAFKYMCTNQPLLHSQHPFPLAASGGNLSGGPATAKGE